MSKKLKSLTGSNAPPCSPSSGGEMECTLTRDKIGMLGILSAPPIFLCTRESIEDLIDRHNDMLRERDIARRMWSIHQDKLAELREQVRLTIMENLHLADGDVCTLKRLKDSISFDLDSPENAGSDAPGATETKLK
jgi:hypothetical protein